MGGVRIIPGQRTSTTRARLKAVQRVIDVMRTRPSEPFSLGELARLAFMSPFHFNRVFHEITGLPPCRFLSALRIETAKRLLLETELSVTTICFEVGYESLGSFITRFSEHVGVSPRVFRSIAGRAAPVSETRAGADPDAGPTRRADGRVHVEARLPGGRAQRVFLGLFATDIPHGRPGRCLLAGGPGRFVIDDVPDGRWYLYGASMPEAADPAEFLCPGSRNLLVARHAGPVDIIDGGTVTECALDFRPADPTDPPLLLALNPLTMTGRGPRAAVRRMATSAACRETGPNRVLTLGPGLGYPVRGHGRAD